MHIFESLSNIENKVTQNRILVHIDLYLQDLPMIKESAQSREEG